MTTQTNKIAISPCLWFNKDAEEAIKDPDTAAAKRAMEAMMQMVKIDIAKIEAARRG